MLERVKGIEPSSQAWEARILPLNHTRFRCASARQARLRCASAFSRITGFGATSRRGTPAAHFAWLLLPDYMPAGNWFAMALRRDSEAVDGFAQPALNEK